MARRHPNHQDLYTPMTDDLRAFLDECRDIAGSWNNVAYQSGLRPRQMRRIRLDNKTTCLSMRVMDRIITGVGHGGLHEWLWFEADDLVRLGIWDPPQYVEGRTRVQGDKSTYLSRLDLQQRRKLRRKKRKQKARAAKKREEAALRKFWEEILEGRSS